MIQIDGKDYSITEVAQVFDLCRDLLRDNETMRANVIAMSAKLDNEEAKVRKLIHMINYQNEIHKYEA
jgi:hypothetical protein